MYTLELIGFCNSKRITGLTLEQARAEFNKARVETFAVKDDPGGLNHGSRASWNMWELFLDGELVADGQF